MAVSFTEVRADLARVLDRVAEGEEITITRHGRPVAVLVRPDRLRSRVDWVFAEAAQFRVEFDNADPAPGSIGLSEERAAELLRDVREARASR